MRVRTTTLCRIGALERGPRRRLDLADRYAGLLAAQLDLERVDTFEATARACFGRRRAVVVDRLNDGREAALVCARGRGAGPGEPGALAAMVLVVLLQHLRGRGAGAWLVVVLGELGAALAVGPEA